MLRYCTNPLEESCLVCQESEVSEEGCLPPASAAAAAGAGAEGEAEVLPAEPPPAPAGARPAAEGAGAGGETCAVNN